MEHLIDTMPAIGPDYTAILCLCEFLNDIPRISEQHAWLDDFYRFVQAFS